MFLFSNLSLFILLPFAYLFTESAGFTNTPKVSVIMLVRGKGEKGRENIKILYVFVTPISRC